MHDTTSTTTTGMPRRTKLLVAAGLTLGLALAWALWNVEDGQAGTRIGALFGALVVALLALHGVLRALQAWLTGRRLTAVAIALFSGTMTFVLARAVLGDFHSW